MGLNGRVLACLGAQASDFDPKHGKKIRLRIFYEVEKSDLLPRILLFPLLSLCSVLREEIFIIWQSGLPSIT